MLSCLSTTVPSTVRNGDSRCCVETGAGTAATQKSANTKAVNFMVSFRALAPCEKLCPGARSPRVLPCAFAKRSPSLSLQFHSRRREERAPQILPRDPKFPPNEAFSWRQDGCCPQHRTGHI